MTKGNGLARQSSFYENITLLKASSMTECEAMDKILGECPGLSVRADGVDVFAELINVMNLAYFMQEA